MVFPLRIGITNQWQPPFGGRRGRGGVRLSLSGRRRVSWGGKSGALTLDLAIRAAIGGGGRCLQPAMVFPCEIPARDEERPHAIDSFNGALEQVTMIAAHIKGVPHNHRTSRFDRQWVPPLCVHAPKRA